MAEKKKVQLLSEIIHGRVVNGTLNYFKYSPAKGREVKHTLIPIDLYNSLKDAKPPVFVDAVEVVVEDIEGVSEEAVALSAPQTINKDDRLAPLPEINMADASDLDNIVDEENDNADADTLAVKELSKIKGIGSGLANTLVDAGFKTIYDVALADEDHLIALDGISERTVGGILESAKELTAE